MIAPPRWDIERLTTEAKASRAIFRKERIEEPLAKWKDAFDHYRSNFARLLNDYGGDNPAAITPERLAAIFGEKLGDELRYLAGPPISADDLKVLAETTLAPGVLKKDGEASKRIIDTILQTLDPYRFPWIAEKRQPTEAERFAAILASAALLTKQRVQTDRANEGKDAQEAAVKAFLAAMQFKEIPARPIPNLTVAPPPGSYSGEALVGSRKADVPVRLHDGRLMPIECKVTNSSTNSVKRLNNDAAVKAAIWTKEFGTAGVVPVAILSGVFKIHNLMQAQDGNLTIFWAHDLEPMREFIESTGKNPH